MLNNIILDIVKLPFRKEKELFSSLHAILGFYPRNIEYYKLALMHKSVARRSEKGKPINNERLEFLGDAILGAVVGDIVYKHFEGKREGFLTNTRSKLVQRETLGKLADEMGITKLILASSRGHSHNSYVGGNAFEALVGAIYLDRGYSACKKFVQKRILKQLINIDKVAYKEVNFKSKLLEWSQKNRVKLDYKVLDQNKEPNGSPVFTCQAVLEGVDGGIGKGYSKKEAQQLASKETLTRLRREPQYIDAIFAAKTSRTKMEETPVMAVPKMDENTEIIIATAKPEKENKAEAKEEKKPKTRRERKPVAKEKNDEFDLSDITAKPKELSREDIIAMAEQAAFGENK